MNALRIGDRLVGRGHPVYVVAEIGINHNGDLSTALQLIDSAVKAGCDAVKFQKRTPELCVPEHERGKMRQTPWGYMRYIEYRKRVEFGVNEYCEIDRYCKSKGISWTASCWDEPSVDFLEVFAPPFYKIASAAITNLTLLRKHRETGRPIVLSTGMSTMDEIRAGVAELCRSDLLIAHSTSAYPCAVEELNLRMIETLQREFWCPIGYSGHEAGLPTTVAAVAMGACYVERHITLDRAMWGSDQAASVEPAGFERLVKYIRAVERALGDGVKRVYESEIPVRARLRSTVAQAQTTPVGR
jgi:N-acetylneuraminate synthase